MASRTQIILIDDLDGGEAEESIVFALDGVQYEVDLSAANADALREALAPYIGAGRRVGGRAAKGRAKPGKSGGKFDLADVRSWARDNGYQVSDRGRVSADVLSAYENAH